jgi:hypothetical protein
MFAFIGRKNRSSTTACKSRSQFRSFLEALEDRYLPSADVLDPTFGSGGLVNTTSNSNTGAHAIATYPNEGTVNDGKIAAVWVAFSYNGTPYMSVARYNLNGTLDSTFAGTGEVFNP